MTIKEFALIHGVNPRTVRTQLRNGHCQWPRKTRDMSIDTGHFLYNTWRRMIQRCHSPRDCNYLKYGGRGITVDVTWRCNRVGFKNFIAYVEGTLGPRPSGYTLDRINNKGNYEPGNVRWANGTWQNLNKRANQDSTSAIRGVSFDNWSHKWKAQLTYRGVRLLNKRYPTEEEAARAYLDALSKLKERL